MNSSPVHRWDDFITQEAIYTFFATPWVVKTVCLAVLALVVWFIVSAYRFEGRGRDHSATTGQSGDP